LFVVCFGDVWPYIVFGSDENRKQSVLKLACNNHFLCCCDWISDIAEGRPQAKIRQRGKLNMSRQQEKLNKFT
jgi:hypothetical protein